MAEAALQKIIDQGGAAGTHVEDAGGERRERLRGDGGVNGGE